MTSHSPSQARLGARARARSGVCAAALALVTAAAHASTITVTSTADDFDHGPNGNCTLREAVIAANTNTKVDECTRGGGPDTIVIPAGTYTLTIPGASEDAAHTGDLDVTAAVSITGAGMGGTMIDVGGLDNGIDVRVQSGTSTISGLTIRHAGGAGVALHLGKLDLSAVELGSARSSPSAQLVAGLWVAAGAATVDGATLVDNAGPGAAVSGGSLTLSTSTVTGNGDGDAGGILVEAGEVTLRSSTIGDPDAVTGSCTGNDTPWAGGGVRVLGGTVRIEDSRIVGNCSVLVEPVGGGLAIRGGTVALVRSLVARNAALGDPKGSGGVGGGIYVAGASLAVTDSRVSANYANSASPFPEPGGLAVDHGAHVTIERSIFDGNEASAIGVLGLDSVLELRDSTVSGRAANDVPAHPSLALASSVAIESFGTVAIVGSTIDTARGEPQAAIAGPGEVTVLNSVIDGPCTYGGFGTTRIRSFGFNVAADPDCGLTQGSDLTGVDPLLAALDDYGGGRPTRAPLPGSPVVDSGDPAGCTPTDQRGIARPQDGDGDGSARCDRGAVEVACTGWEGTGGECVPLACGAVPRSPGAAAALAPLAVVLTWLGRARPRRARTVVAGLLLALAVSTAHASTITVTSTADDYDQGPNGNCTLREAVIAANTNTKTDKCTAGGGADTIVIPAGIYTLTIPGTGEDAAHTGDLDLTAAVTITGAGVGATVIDVGGLDNGFEVRVKSGTSSLSRLTIRNAGGVGIANRGSKLRLTDASVEDSTGIDALSDPLSGGAIYQTNGTLTASRVDVRGTDGGSAWMMAGGVATLDTCTARDADAFIDAGGGGLTITGGDVSVTGSMIGDESADPLVSCSNRARSLGGGVYVSGGRLELADSVVAGNCASLPWFEGGAGGALAILGGSVHLSRTRVVRNIAWPERFSGLSEGGGILLRGGSLVVEESRISQNLAFVLAGGIAVEADASADLERSSVDGNAFQAIEARLDVAGRLLVRDSTITGDPLGLVPAPFRAWGGVDASGAVTIVGSTIQAGSDPDRIVAAIGSSHGAVSVKSSIIEGACEIDSGGSIASAGYNLGSDLSCALGQPSDLVGVDPHLAPLGFYGGPTPTMPPLPGSPAIDSGDPDGCTASDQRGFARPQDGNLDGTARCDRGAVEVACSGIDGTGAECVPLGCGSVPRAPWASATAALPLLVASAAIQRRRLAARRRH